MEISRSRWKYVDNGNKTKYIEILGKKFSLVITPLVKI